MKGEERIRHYLDRAFYGVRQTSEIQEEKEALLAELTEKYLTLTSQGYEPEAAYQSVISGIGDIFELVDGIAGEAVSTEGGSTKEAVSQDPSVSDQSAPPLRQREISPRLMEAFPYAAAGILFFFWVMGRIFPAGPKNQETIPFLILGAAAGAVFLWLFLTYPKPTALNKISGSHIAIAILWIAAALLFFQAAAKPHLKGILWLIPIGALAATQLIFAWMSYQDLKKRGDLDE